jgi:hypothetical protein
MVRNLAAHHIVGAIARSSLGGSEHEVSNDSPFDLQGKDPELTELGDDVLQKPENIWKAGLPIR